MSKSEGDEIKQTKITKKSKLAIREGESYADFARRHYQGQRDAHTRRSQIAGQTSRQSRVAGGECVAGLTVLPTIPQTSTVALEQAGSTGQKFVHKINSAIAGARESEVEDIAFNIISSMRRDIIERNLPIEEETEQLEQQFHNIHDTVVPRYIIDRLRRRVFNARNREAGDTGANVDFDAMGQAGATEEKQSVSPAGEQLITDINTSIARGGDPLEGAYGVIRRRMINIERQQLGERRERELLTELNNLVVENINNTNLDDMIISMLIDDRLRLGATYTPREAQTSQPHGPLVDQISNISGLTSIINSSNQNPVLQLQNTIVMNDEKEATENASSVLSGLTSVVNSALEGRRTIVDIVLGAENTAIETNRDVLEVLREQTQNLSIGRQNRIFRVYQRILEPAPNRAIQVQAVGVTASGGGDPGLDEETDGLGDISEPSLAGGGDPGFGAADVQQVAKKIAKAAKKIEKLQKIAKVAPGLVDPLIHAAQGNYWALGTYAGGKLLTGGVIGAGLYGAYKYMGSGQITPAPTPAPTPTPTFQNVLNNIGNVWDSTYGATTNLIENIRQGQIKNDSAYYGAFGDIASDIGSGMNYAGRGMNYAGSRVRDYMSRMPNTGGGGMGGGFNVKKQKTKVKHTPTSAPIIQRVKTAILGKPKPKTKQKTRRRITKRKTPNFCDKYPNHPRCKK